MVNLPKLVKKKLSDVLLEEGLVPANHLAEATNRQKASNEPLSVILQKMGVISESELARAFCKQFNLPYIDAARYSVPKEVTELLDVEDMQRNHYVVLDKIGKVLLIAVADMPPLEALEGIERATGSTLFVFVSTPTQVQAALKKHFANGKAKGAAPPPAAAPAKPAPAAPTAPDGAPNLSGPAQTGFKVIPAKPQPKP